MFFYILNCCLCCSLFPSQGWMGRNMPSQVCPLFSFFFFFIFNAIIFSYEVGQGKECNLMYAIFSLLLLIQCLMGSDGLGMLSHVFHFFLLFLLILLLIPNEIGQKRNMPSHVCHFFSSSSHSMS